MSRIFPLPGAVKRDPAVAKWFDDRGELGAIALRWFDVMRACGDDVRELLHDGHPTACIGDIAFCYVNAFASHVNVGFFLGAELDDQNGLLIGTGKFMRHAKIEPNAEIDATSITDLIAASYTDMKSRIK
ncbi:MAG: DUF1801 domain-containing protein [Pyrinomonadaceae bacterium]